VQFEAAVIAVLAPAGVLFGAAETGGAGAHQQGADAGRHNTITFHSGAIRYFKKSRLMK